MKLRNSPRVGINNPDLQAELREHALQVNGLSEGRIANTYNAQTAAPTTGDFAIGDIVRNSAPTETGSPAFVVYGWMCLDDNPLTFVPLRIPTGN